MYPYGQPPYARPGIPPGMPPGMPAPFGMAIPGVPGVPGAPPAFGMPPGAAPPGVALPPGMAPPPGVGAPGTVAPPGTAQANMPARGMGPAGFAPPANLPNINFNAPVIRLGTSATRQNPLPTANAGPAKGPGAGAANTQNELLPPTVEEQLKTVFVGAIPGGVSDEWMERILRSAATLKKWTRATDGNGKPCRFGFAEYEDPQSLGCAIEVLKDLEIPPVDDRTEGAKLVVTIDDKSQTYLENIEEANGDHLEFRIDTARADLERTLAEFKDPSKHAKPTDDNADKTETPKADGADSTQPEIVEIPLSADDELSDIPADMREMVAKEIAAFRERSNRRDMERMKREEEIEKQERERNNPSQSRINRLASPAASTPSGPSGGANAIPIGPSRLREGSQPRIPTGPSAGVQTSRDYQKGVSFVNGHSTAYYTKEEEEADISDTELDRRKKAKKAAEQEKAFQDAERRWLNRERSRTSALERERQRDEDDLRRAEADKAAMAKRLAEWDDDVEAEKATEEYYRDRSLWMRTRSAFRQREMEHDERDRQLEARQAEQEGDKKRAAESMADSFLAQQAAELEKAAAAAQKQEPQRFKLSLGAAAASRRQAEAPRRKTAADVENLLEDEEDDTAKTRRAPLIPIPYTAGSLMDDETRDKLVRQLAQEIPSDKEGLFAWKVLWDQVDESILKEKLQPFVEKKIVEYLGVQEQDLIDFVIKHIRNRGEPEELVKELEMTLDEDAETMVRKVWRMLIFYTESEKRGLN